MWSLVGLTLLGGVIGTGFAIALSPAASQSVKTAMKARPHAYSGDIHFRAIGPGERRAVCVERGRACVKSVLHPCSDRNISDVSRSAFLVLWSIWSASSYWAVHSLLSVST